MRFRAPPWPIGDEHSSSIFFTVLAESCAADQPDLARRFRAFAEDYTTPAERKRRRLAQRNDLIRQMAADHYPRSLGSNGRARLISEHLTEIADDERPPPVRRQNLALREIVDLNDGSAGGLGFENVKIILRGPG